MTVLTQHTQKILEVAEDYRRRGYIVYVEPTEKNLPSFLKDFRPDLVAEGPEDSVVVEVKKGGNKAAQSWPQLMERIKQHPGWRFEVVGLDRDADIVSSLLTAPEIERRIDQGQKLLRSASIDAALLVVWSATEAILRHIVNNNNINTPDYRTGTLITRIYGNGEMDKEDYNSLIQGMRFRNSLTHGFSVSITKENVRQVITTTKRLFAEHISTDATNSMALSR
jgi:REase_AHJR-like